MYIDSAFCLRCFTDCHVFISDIERKYSLLYKTQTMDSNFIGSDFDCHLLKVYDKTRCLTHASCFSSIKWGRLGGK